MGCSLAGALAIARLNARTTAAATTATAATAKTTVDECERKYAHFRLVLGFWVGFRTCSSVLYMLAYVFIRCTYICMLVRPKVQGRCGSRAKDDESENDANVGPTSTSRIV